MPNDPTAAPEAARASARRPEPDLRWGRRKRLQFIDFRLTWEGRINRADLIDCFGISVPQASGDLAVYQQIAPENLHYDRRERTYAASESFAPVFPQPPETYLNQLLAVAQGVIDPAEAWTPPAALGADRFAAVPHVHRRIDAAVLRAVLRAIRGGLDLELDYQSMSRIAPRRRWIGPRALVFDGSRWHARAWCHTHGDWRDFVLARIAALTGERPAAPPAARDADWEAQVRVVLVPHPRLTAAQRQAIARDYGMQGGRLALSVRRALLFYFLRRYALAPDAAHLPPEEHQVVVANPDEVWPPAQTEPELPFASSG